MWTTPYIVVVYGIPIYAATIICHSAASTPICFLALIRILSEDRPYDTMCYSSERCFLGRHRSSYSCSARPWWRSISTQSGTWKLFSQWLWQMSDYVRSYDAFSENTTFPPHVFLYTYAGRPRSDSSRFVAQKAFVLVLYRPPTLYKVARDCSIQGMLYVTVALVLSEPGPMLLRCTRLWGSFWLYRTRELPSYMQVFRWVAFC